MKLAAASMVKKRSTIMGPKCIQDRLKGVESTVAGHAGMTGLGATHVNYKTREDGSMRTKGEDQSSEDANHGIFVIGSLVIKQEPADDLDTTGHDKPTCGNIISHDAKSNHNSDLGLPYDHISDLDLPHDLSSDLGLPHDHSSDLGLPHDSSSDLGLPHDHSSNLDLSCHPSISNDNSTMEYDIVEVDSSKLYESGTICGN